MTATAGAEHLLYRVVPFSSGAGLPDYLLWAEEGGRAAGFLDAEWRLPLTLSGRDSCRLLLSLPDRTL
jgi:hypothetical protein